MRKKAISGFLGLCLAAAILNTSAAALAEDTETAPVSEEASQENVALPTEETGGTEPEAEPAEDEPLSREKFLTLLAEETGEDPDELAAVLGTGGPEENITRFEAAAVFWEILQNRGEEPADVSGAAYRLPDYASLPDKYREAALQVYARGILTGENISPDAARPPFAGNFTLTAAEAEEAVDRLLNAELRTEHSLVDNNPYRQPDAPNGTTPMALWLQEHGYLRGTETTEKFNQLFFGDPDKEGFEEDEEYADWLVKVTLPVWQIDENGEKFATSMDLRVHKWLAADLYDIFTEIFEDEEQFPVILLGCMGFKSDMRHSWGCAVDVNSAQNAEMNNVIGRVVVSSGQGWWPSGTEMTEWHGLMREESPYSIPAGGSVVRAFADYGWGWGGSWTGNYRDFMHFSILPDGG